MSASTPYAPPRLSRCAGVLAAALLLLAAPSCVDPERSSDCTEREECADPGEMCIGPDESLCGVDIEDACSDHEECDEGGRCHPTVMGCPGDGLSTECGPPCDPGTSAGGFRCDADGVWEPIPCGEGYACGALERCGPGGARSHGCGPISCGAGAPCEEGVCVNGQCQSGPGRCQPPPQ